MTAEAECEWREVAPAEVLASLTRHEVGYSCASYLAAAGLSQKDVQTAIGDADIRITLNVYAKGVPGWESTAATKLDSHLERATVHRHPQRLRAVAQRSETVL